nr:RNA-directed DNA polymerase, eukaryota [Tanacetum cinerariifolium]
MEGYSFTWSHSSASKMSKLDRFLVSEGIFVTFPTISAICIDRHLSDHRPILLNEIHTNYGPTPFRVFHSWFKRDGFDALVKNAWNSFTHNDSNRMIRFKKKLQALKKIIRVWIRESNASQVGAKKVILDDLVIIDKNLEKVGDLDKEISIEEIRKAVWDCGESKSPGPDGFTFEFFRRYWNFIGPDFCAAVNCFFNKGRFPRGSNSSFIALIPKVMDAKWTVKTLSIGGRLTLLKSVLGAVPIYNMSLYKASKCVLYELERLRNNFFTGGDSHDSKITWVAWAKVLSSKKNGGLEYLVFSPSTGLFFSNGYGDTSFKMVLCGDDLNTRFWFDTWILDLPLNVRFPRLFAVELDKDISVAAKWSAPSFDASLRRYVRDGVERNQWSALLHMLGMITLSSSPDRYFCDLNGDDAYRVKDICFELDNLFLPSSVVATRWVNLVPIKVNIFAWRVSLDHLLTRGNLISRGVTLDSPLCPICELSPKDSSHLVFSCELGKSISQIICR